MTGKPVIAPRESEKVLFPDPANPVTMTRRPIAKAASGMTSVSQVEVGQAVLAGGGRLGSASAQVRTVGPVGITPRASLQVGCRSGRSDRV